MIVAKELNPHNYPTTPGVQANLSILLERLNRVRAAYGKPMTITSGLRSDAQQQSLIAAGRSNAPHSKHLTGQAADVLDSDGELRDWVKANMPLMEEVGFWFEDFGYCPNWVHFQVVAPASGHRVFIP